VAPLTSRLQPLLQELVAIRKPEQFVLEEIRRDVHALLEGPWHAGDLFLVEAAQTDQPVAARIQSIEQARRRFIDRMRPQLRRKRNWSRRRAGAATRAGLSSPGAPG
jgi:hypothetical protein